MDLQEKRQIDLATPMARVRARTRPWRSIIALALAVVAGAAASTEGESYPGNSLGWWLQPDHVMAKIVTAAAAAGFGLFAAVAVLGLSGSARDLLRPLTGSAHATVVRFAIVLIGGVTVLFITLALFKISPGKLLVGGAVTTILLGIAAQASLANVFAGIVLLLSRPFMVGERIRLQSGSLGKIEGTVTEIGITYVRIATADGPLHLPNSQVLAAAVGPVPPAQLEPAEDRPTPPSHSAAT